MRRVKTKANSAYLKPVTSPKPCRAQKNIAQKKPRFKNQGFVYFILFLLKFTGYFNFLKAFNLVAHFNVVKLLNAYTAFVVVLHFFYIVFKAF